MSKNSKEVYLDSDQQESALAVKAWADEAASLLGFAYLEFQEAEHRFLLAKKNLEARAITARESENQRNLVMEKISITIGLGAGSWIYDGKSKFVREGK